MGDCENDNVRARQIAPIVKCQPILVECVLGVRKWIMYVDLYAVGL